MKSKSSDKISGTIIKENLRKYWGASLAAFIILIISSLVLYLVSGKDPEMQNYVLGDFFNFSAYTMSNMPALGALILLPLLLGVAVFNFTHNISSLSIVHSFPFSRTTIFLSNYVSGLILLFTPILLTGLTLLSVTPFGLSSSKPIEENLIYSPPSTWGDLLLWVLASLLITLFIYSLTVFAGMITGSAVMHIFVAALLNVIVPVFCFVVIEYFRTFLFGFDISYAYELVEKLHPFTAFSCTFADYQLVPIGHWFIYLGIALIVPVAALILYKKMKYERAGSVFTFKAAEYIIIFLVSLLGMSAVGAVVSGIYDRMNNPQGFRAVFYIGCILGAIITFIIANMIAKKSFRIFGKKLLKRFACFSIVAIVFLVLTTIDVTGFQKYVPSPDREGLTVSINKNLPMMIPFKHEYSFLDDRDIVINESLENVTALHSEIVNNIDKYSLILMHGENDSYYMDEPQIYDQGRHLGVDYSPSGLTFHYTAGKRYDVRRTYYDLYSNALVESDAFKNFIDCEAFVTATTLEELISYDSLLSLRTTFQGMNTEHESVLIRGQDLKEFVKCLDEDYISLSADQKIIYEDDLLDFQINYKDNTMRQSWDEHGALSEEEGESWIIYAITKDYKKSIAWLKQHDLYDKMIAEYEVLAAKYSGPYYIRALPDDPS